MRPMTAWLADKLRLPGAPTTTDDAESHTRLVVHRETLNRRPAFRQVVLDVQADISRVVGEETSQCSNRHVLEIGAGVIAMSALDHDTISSDIHWSDDLQLVLSAYDIPLRSRSLRAVVAQNVFHHLPDYRAALVELSRVIQPGGVIVLVEPHHGFLARHVYPALFAFEGYSLDTPLVEGADRQSKPNQALSYVVFDRERERFEREFPNLQLVRTEPLRSGVRYLATGGLNFRQVLPTFALNAIRRLERSRFGGVLQANWAMHWIVVLRVGEQPHPDLLIARD
jgi:SAM-dependent methyltransferase